MTQPTLYALVLNEQIVRTQEFDETPPLLAPNKGAWLPIVDEPAMPSEAETVVTQTVFEADRVRRVEMAVPKPLDQLKAEKRAAIVAACQASFAAGFAVTTGTMAGHVLKLATVEDRTNWLTLTDDCRSAIAAGRGAEPGAVFRTASNVMFSIPWTEGLDVLDAMKAWGKRQYANMWAMKDALDPATTPAEVAAINHAEGWI